MFLNKCRNNSCFVPLNKINIYKGLNKKVFYNYNNLLGSPVDALSINVLINADLEILKIFKYDMGLTWGSSLVLGSLVLRCMLSLIKYSLQKFKFKRYDERPLIKKFIKEVFLNDLNSDIKFYNLKESEAQRLRNYYYPSTLLSNFFNGYLVINWFRALNHITSHYDQFPLLNIETFLSADNLVKHDESGLFGTLIMPLNYFLLTTSRHPFFIRMNKPENKVFRMNIAFMSCLVSYMFPSCYLISYISFASSHLVFNYFYFKYESRREKKILEKYGLSDSEVVRYRSINK